MVEVTARLAPSPTGVLHLGNARSFLLAWLNARAVGGRVLMRIEDIDGPRVKAGAIEKTLEDLEWMGLDWDGEPLLQSTRLEHYRSVSNDLLERGLAYPCVCSRKEIEEAASAPHEAPEHATPVYPGTCRGRFKTLDEAEAETGVGAALRFHVDAEFIPFEDGYCGAQEGEVRGDFVIQKRDGDAAYQLACVIDDAETGVTEVLRADDLIPSTPRQLALFSALGHSPPVYVHTPLLVGPDGRRLAKRHGDTSLQFLKSNGWTGPSLVGYLAHLSGLRDEASPCTPTDLLSDGFALDRVPREPAVVQLPTV